jgi:hypothetical protein
MIEIYSTMMIGQPSRRPRAITYERSPVAFVKLDVRFCRNQKLYVKRSDFLVKVLLQNQRKYNIFEESSVNFVHLHPDFFMFLSAQFEHQNPKQPWGAGSRPARLPPISAERS